MVKKNFLSKIREKVPLFALIIGVILVITAIIHILTVFIPDFADFINEKISPVFRFILAKISGIFNFSIAEALIWLLPVFLVSATVYIIRIVKADNLKAQKNLMFALLSALAGIYILFVFTLGTGYRGHTLDEKMDLKREPVSASELKETCLKLNEGINASIGEVDFALRSSSIMPYSFSELNDKLNKTYADVCEKYDFISKLSSRVKPVVASNLMTYTHISGVYSFFTGEANLNTNYPDYIMPFTMAHEMAHQRGIAREDEANFIAFIVCISSDDPFIRYSGYTQVFEYTLSALGKADKSAYNSVYSLLDEKYKYELSAYNKFFTKYESNVAEKVSTTVNDSFQKIQGQKAGIESYGLVVDLAVAYYKSESK